MTRRSSGVEQNSPLAGLRARLVAPQPIPATFVMIPRVEIVEMLAAAGFEAAIFDLEHGPIEVSDLLELAAVAHGSDMYAIARMPSADPAAIGRALDAGVDGILVPHVGSRTDAEALIAAGRFPPTGNRSLNPYTRGTRYRRGEESGPDDANRRVALIAMLEGDDALAALEEICTTAELDGAFVGPVDLSAALGIPGQPEHRRVVDTVRQMFARIEAAGCASGVYADTPEAAARWAGAGGRLIALSADAAMAIHGFTSYLGRTGLDRETATSVLVQSGPDGQP